LTSAGDEALPAALADRLARVRALEDYRSLLSSSDVLAPATALIAAPKQPAASSGGNIGGSVAAGSPAPLDLLTAALLIARHARPRLDEAWCRGEVSRLAAAVDARMAPGAPRYPLRMVKEVNAVGAL
jgi:hypothetical protein